MEPSGPEAENPRVSNMEPSEPEAENPITRPPKPAKQLKSSRLVKFLILISIYQCMLGITITFSERKNRDHRKVSVNGVFVPNNPKICPTDIVWKFRDMDAGLNVILVFRPPDSKSPRCIPKVFVSFKMGCQSN
ncbi:hypothetical protein AVEN_9005-1 [Araneus ventricosus]|uniref:Uncharacterized protein n=1 Tax=Araneus ventricosus TaxID=182803 RepID=A0A4Y2DPK3_ARAVE|nr:hypothetical protein AVEN_9005-1 [Araneus ventricosus]